MNSVSIRFYGELNDFLRLNQRYIAFTHFFNGQPSVKDLIESLGVPHPEVDMILIDGESADFSRKLLGDEIVSVYPLFSSLDVSAVTRVRPAELSEFRFILDVHLGKLASYLRMVGFDTLYSNDASDDKLADISAAEDRILLSFDRVLLKRSSVAYGYCVRSRDPAMQLIEVLKHFDLFGCIHPFERCMRCNGILRPIPKEDILNRLPKKVRDSLNEFQLCSGCGRIYWKGTHYRRMNDFLNKIVENRT
ncbi:MAG: Mut7-C RNAse domain-containing protein [Clostridiaceae bacterium]